MKPLHPSIAHIPLPIRMKRLYVDDRGFPVPFFVGYPDGKHPDHRTVDPLKLAQCIRGKLCWLCGQRLGDLLTCVIGPMCAVNRNTSESPSHRSCALYAVKTCPFLTRPHAHRREAGLPEDISQPGGIAIDRNPGVALVWVTRKVKRDVCPNTVDGNQLCEMGRGSQVTPGYPSGSERLSAHSPLTRSQSPAR